MAERTARWDAHKRRGPTRVSEPTATFLGGGREPEDAFRIVGRVCFLAAAATALAAAAILAFAAPALAGDVRLALVASLISYAALSAWTCQRSAGPCRPVLCRGGADAR